MPSPHQLNFLKPFAGIPHLMQLGNRHSNYPIAFFVVFPIRSSYLLHLPPYDVPPFSQSKSQTLELHWISSAFTLPDSWLKVVRKWKTNSVGLEIRRTVTSICEESPSGINKFKPCNPNWTSFKELEGCGALKRNWEEQPCEGSSLGKIFEEKKDKKSSRTAENLSGLMANLNQTRVGDRMVSYINFDHRDRDGTSFWDPLDEIVWKGRSHSLNGLDDETVSQSEQMEVWSDGKRSTRVTRESLLPLRLMWESKPDQECLIGTLAIHWFHWLIERSFVDETESTSGRIDKQTKEWRKRRK